jgi:hypothetical protein
MMEDPQPQNAQDPAAEQPPEEPTQPAQEHDTPGDQRKLYRDTQALTATIDQHSAELDAINAVLLLQAFAFGVLAAIVFMQGRKITELADALTG